jgi:hypothetical protein
VWLKQKEAQEKELEEQKYTQKLLQVCISWFYRFRIL